MIAAILTCFIVQVPPTPVAATTDEVVARAVAQLIDIQEPEGAWPYEGVYRVNGQIPIGYRVGGTALVCQALLHAAPATDTAANTALGRGVEFIFKGLDDPLMQPSKVDRYDVRVWGHACALEFLCHLKRSARLPARAEFIDQRIQALVGALLFEQLEDGGWNYATRRRHAAFVTAPVLQALLWARESGAAVPAGALQRGRAVLESSRVESGAYFYSGVARAEVDARAQVPGSIARAPLCETTLTLLGGSSPIALRQSIEDFFKHWDELENRRRKTGTHKPPYGIAPYYFYFGHRYASQAIELLPETERLAARRRMNETLMGTRDDDGTWNDRVFERSRNFGTAMSLMVLVAPRVPLPPAAVKRASGGS